jgi:hypothetical protein
LILRLGRDYQAARGFKATAWPAFQDAVQNVSQGAFSSRWRYETGMHSLEAWSRQGKSLGLNEAIRLLQQVAHGTTEYSVIFLANEGRILFAVDDLETDMWDAPYVKWIEFRFDELFKR